MRIVLALLCAAAALLAQPLDQGERNRALSELHASRKAFLDSITGLSKAQWNYKPAPDRWSIAECAEHITVTEDMLFQMVTGKVMKSPAGTVNRAEARKQDEQILKRMADRTQKAQASEAMKPSGRWPDAEAMAAHFRESRDKLIDYVRTTQEPLRAHSTPGVGGAPMDAYQWILLIAGHAGRHVEQIQEVKASSGYPK